MPSAAEDRDEITQLLYRYNHTIDSGDVEAWADTFTPDGVFDQNGPMLAGREALRDFALTVHGFRHALVNPLIDVAGDEATARSYLYAFRGTTVVVTAIYEDLIVRTPDGWRFAKRTCIVDPPSRPKAP